MIKLSGKHLHALLNLATQMVQESLGTSNSPCVKPSRACEKTRDRKNYHKRYYLSWTEGGRTQMMYSLPRRQRDALAIHLKPLKDCI